jgi:PII-like signaling protein
MAASKKQKVLRIYLDEKMKWQTQLLYRALVEKLLKLGIPGATVFRGLEGFGASAQIHDARILEMSENLPVVVEVVAAPKVVLACLNQIRPMLPKNALVTMQDIQVMAL